MCRSFFWTTSFAEVGAASCLDKKEESSKVDLNLELKEVVNSKGKEKKGESKPASSKQVCSSELATFQDFKM